MSHREKVLFLFSNDYGMGSTLRCVRAYTLEAARRASIVTVGSRPKVDIRRAMKRASKQPKIALIFAAPIWLQGCVPMPHVATIAPAVTGTIQSGGDALTGARVVYFHKKITNEIPDCSGSDATTLTDDQGRFAFEEGKEFRWLISMGDPLYRYDICLETPVERQLLWANRDFGQLENPAEITCDMDLPVREDPQGRGRGRCAVRWTKWEN